VAAIVLGGVGAAVGASLGHAMENVVRRSRRTGAVDWRVVGVLLLLAAGIPSVVLVRSGLRREALSTPRVIRSTGESTRVPVTEAPMAVSNTDCEREVDAKPYVQQLDEIAARERRRLPVTLLIEMVRLSGEALDAGSGTMGAAARDQSTRCGAIHDAAVIPATRSETRRR
jgi:hypothetical protein